MELQDDTERYLTDEEKDKITELIEQLEKQYFGGYGNWCATVDELHFIITESRGRKEQGNEH